MARHSAQAGFLAILFLAQSPAVAEELDRLDLGGFIGVHLFNDDNELGQDDFDQADSLGNAFAFGIRIALRLVPNLSAEGELGFTSSRSRLEAVDVVQFGWRAHGLFHPVTLAGGRLEPFALLGAGASTASSNDPERFRNDTDFVVHTGLGARVRIGADWGARIDARLALPPSSASETVTTDWEFLAAVYRSFGTRPAPSPTLSAPSSP
jgi:hypothetical protein